MSSAAAKVRRGVDLSPAFVTLDTMAQQQFTVAGVRLTGDSASTAVSYTSTGGTISSTGLYSAGRVNGNNFHVIATHQKSNTADTSAINIQGNPTVPPVPPPVATVDLAPLDPVVIPAGTVQMSAVVRDTNGQVLTGRVITWTSATDSIATISNAGLITGVKEGITSVTATSEGKSASTGVSVEAPIAPPPPGTFHEPAGHTLIGDRAFNWIATCSNGATREAGWDDVEGCPQINGGNFTIASDPTAPVSANNVAQMRYPLGFAGGSSPAVAQRFWSAGLGYRQLYLRYWIKVSSGFEGHMTSTNKIFHFWIGNPGGNRAFDRLVGVDLGNLDYQLALQGTPAAETRTRLVGNRGVSTTIARDQWYRIEIQLMANTPGSSNGVARAWINGQLAIEYTDIQLVGAGESPVWSQVQWSPTWGGGGDVTTGQFFMWMDQAYISGGP